MAGFMPLISVYNGMIQLKKEEKGHTSLWNLHEMSNSALQRNNL